jgi:hypothetical protein
MQLFMQAIQSTQTDSFYLAMSHVDPWAPISDTPPILTDSVKNKVYAWRNIIGGKRITGNDITLAVPRNNWANNTIYNFYDSSIDNSNTNQAVSNTGFYVLTSDYNVYKCISNANNSPSIVEPSSINYSIPNQETDGYVWKYLYSLSLADRIRFLTDSYMPVKTLTYDNGTPQYQVQHDAVNGGILNILVNDSSNSFTNSANINIVISGDGTGAVAEANIVSNTIHSIIMDLQGQNYTFANASVYDASISTFSHRANLSVIISPQGGHGSDPENELEATHLIINSKISDTENGVLSVQLAYRQILLIHNPISLSTNNVYMNTAFSQTTDLILTAGGGDYTLAEYVYQGPDFSDATFSGKVVYWDSGNNIIGLSETSGQPTSTALIGGTSGTQRLSVLNVSPPDLKYYTGKILYINNDIAIQRNASQSDDIKFILSFN